MQHFGMMSCSFSWQSLSTAKTWNRRCRPKAKVLHHALRGGHIPGGGICGGGGEPKVLCLWNHWSSNTTSRLFQRQRSKEVHLTFSPAEAWVRNVGQSDVGRLFQIPPWDVRSICWPKARDFKTITRYQWDPPPLGTTGWWPGHLQLWLEMRDQGSVFTQAKEEACSPWCWCRTTQITCFIHCPALQLCREGNSGREVTRKQHIICLVVLNHTADALEETLCPESSARKTSSLRILRSPLCRYVRLYRKIRNSKNGNSVFSVKDMHCGPVWTICSHL